MLKSLRQQVRESAKKQADSIVVTWSENASDVSRINDALAEMRGTERSVFLASLFKLCATRKPDTDFYDLFGSETPTPTRFTLGFSHVKTHNLTLWGRNGSESEKVVFEARSASYEALQNLRDTYLLGAVEELYSIDSSKRTEQGWVTVLSPIDQTTGRWNVLSYLKSYFGKLLRRLVAMKTWSWKVPCMSSRQ